MVFLLDWHFLFFLWHCPYALVCRCDGDRMGFSCVKVQQFSNGRGRGVMASDANHNTFHAGSWEDFSTFFFLVSGFY